MKTFITLLLLTLHLFANIPGTTSNTYDAFNRMISSTDELNNTTTNTYDSRGNKVSTTDGQNRTTTYTYNNHNKIIKTEYPDGTTESKTYDAMDNLLSETNQEGETTSYEYDDADRLTKTTYPDGSTTTNTYDAAGRVTSTTDQNGHTTSYEYDAVGNRVSTTDALGNKTTFTYDGEGNMLSATDAKNHTITYGYDAANNKVLTTYADGTTETYTYDTSGNKISTTNQNGITTHYQYDTDNRLIEVKDALGNKTTFTYDSRGNKLTQTDAKGRVTHWTYDKYGSVISRTLPLGQKASSTYDAYGRVATTTDFNGQTTRYTYDPDDRIVRKTYADGSTDTYGYDALGRTTQVIMTDESGTTQTTYYQYDNRGRLTQETQASGAVLDYDYDNAGKLITLTVTNPQGEVSTTRYSYDALNRLSSVTSNEAEMTTYHYDAVGNLKSITYHNGNQALYSYDALNRLIKLEHKDQQDHTLAFFDYQLNAKGERTQITEPNKTTTYTYDDLGRLTDEKITGSTNDDYSAHYTYDAVGNRVSSVIDGVSTNYTYDDNDRLTQQGGSVYTYDDNGNTLTETLDDETTIYSYNAKNQLAQREDSNSTTSYTYNPNGIRTSKTRNNHTTQYLVDSHQAYAQVLQEITNDNTEVSYTYGSDLISQRRGDQTTTYHYDGLGSARYLSDDTGAFTDSYDYEAFGKLLNQEGNTTNHYLYTGEQQDPESKQYYLRARYYAPTTGRFTQQDTYQGNSADPITLHKYLYANANPVTYTDPSGHFSMMDVTMALDVRNTLQNIQIESYSTFTNAMTGGWDGVSLDNIPEIAATAVGLRLLLRFVPRLSKACKNSFDGQTLVATELGLVPIEDIKIGDKVWAYNEANQTKSLQEVTHLIRGEGNKELTDITLNSGEVITATSNHPLWEQNDQNWTEAGKLGLDSILLSKDDTNISIRNLREYQQHTVVYNLTVNNDHTYFVGVGGVLGHNCEAWDRAVSNLGITHLTYKNGTAYIKIGVTENLHFRDIKEVKRMMKSLGNHTLKVDTVFFGNEDFYESVLKKFNNNQTFMGGTIEKGQEGIGDFIIKFIL